MTRTMTYKCPGALAATGVVVLTAGIILPSAFNILLDHELKQMLPLVNGSYSFNLWRTLPVPMDIQFWVFDVVNADEVMDYGATPFVQEKGPYTYSLRKEKVNVTHHANGTVSYRQITWYYFDRERSAGDESDNFTTINNILLGAAYMTRFQFPIVKEMINVMLEGLGGRLYETYTVKDILWGYEDPMLKFIKDDMLGFLNMSTGFDDHFGFFYKWNGTDDGLFTVFTGENDLNRLDRVDRFNGLGYVPNWSTEYAQMLNGTDGTFFPPHLSKYEPLYFYSPEACRSLYMEYTHDVYYKDIRAQRFTFPESLFESGLVNPDNAGFCTPDIHHCMPTGVLNVTGCRDGSSAVMSLPHFLGSDPEVINGVRGLNPDPKQHTSYLSLETVASSPLDVAMRLQINVLVSKFADIFQLKNTHSYYHPILWFNETAAITDDLASKLRNQLILVVNLVDVMKYLLPCLGVVMAISGIVCIHRRRKNLKKTSTKPSETDRLITNTDTDSINVND